MHYVNRIAPTLDRHEQGLVDEIAAAQISRPDLSEYAIGSPKYNALQLRMQLATRFTFGSMETI